jgi:hypothetical protein
MALDEPPDVFVSKTQRLRRDAAAPAGHPSRLVAAFVAAPRSLGHILQASFYTARINRMLPKLRTIELLRFLLLASVADRGQGVLEGLDDEAIKAPEQKLHDKFVRIIGYLPQIQSLIVLNRDAHLLVATDTFPLDASSDFSDRDYFVALTQSAALTYISRVQTSRIGGKTFFGSGAARTRAAQPTIIET